MGQATRLSARDAGRGVGPLDLILAQGRELHGQGGRGRRGRRGRRLTPPGWPLASTPTCRPLASVRWLPRLSEEELERLSAYASTLGLPVSTTVRSMVLDVLAQHGHEDADDLQAALERLERDVRDVKRMSKSA